jgi:antitoxin (DNA-binding transcriptional repressor) of toxin-antitoxin stability system
MAAYTLEEAREKLEDLAEKAAAGEDVRIATKSGVQLRLIPVEVPKELPPRRFGSAKGKVRMLENFDDPIPGFEPYME